MTSISNHANRSSSFIYAAYRSNNIFAVSMISLFLLNLDNYFFIRGASHSCFECAHDNKFVQIYDVPASANIDFEFQNWIGTCIILLIWIIHLCATLIRASESITSEQVHLIRQRHLNYLGFWNLYFDTYTIYMRSICIQIDMDIKSWSQKWMSPLTRYLTRSSMFSIDFMFILYQ